MTERYKKRLIELGRELGIALESQKRIVLSEDYIQNVVEKANLLVGYIAALEE